MDRGYAGSRPVLEAEEAAMRFQERAKSAKLNARKEYRVQ